FTRVDRGAPAGVCRRAGLRCVFLPGNAGLADAATDPAAGWPRPSRPDADPCRDSSRVAWHNQGNGSAFADPAPAEAHGLVGGLHLVRFALFARAGSAALPRSPIDERIGDLSGDPGRRRGEGPERRNAYGSEAVPPAARPKPLRSTSGAGPVGPGPR